MKLEANDVILFNGDSITDRGRDRSKDISLTGYNHIIDQTIKLYRPDYNVTCYNKGVSGDTAGMVLARLKDELETIRPTIFSLLIGINDTWRRYDRNIITTESEFESSYREILELVSEYTNRIVILEPFLLTSDPAKLCFREDLDPKIHIIRKLAVQYKAEYVPMDGVFAEESIKTNAPEFSGDGIHLSDKGHGVIAREWLKRVTI